MRLRAPSAAGVTLLAAFALSGAFAALSASVAPGASPAAGPVVRLEARPAEQRIDVLVNDVPFTSYLYDPAFKKPVLYPLRSDRGQLVTRGFPLAPVPGESADHPHHLGLWLSYGDVNGVDFWNNSATLSPEQQGRMGTIHHRRVVSTSNGPGRGELVVELEWAMPGGVVALKERTRFVFRAAAGERSVDRLTSLEAVGTRVKLADNKEGFIGMRVARPLEHPSREAREFLDSAGRVTKVAPTEGNVATGRYLTSEGVEGEKAWSTRGRWTLLAGRVDGTPVTIAMLDHPGNPGFPTHWHARGYGLFAANPLGMRVFTKGKEALDLTLEPGRSALFRHRVVILSKEASPEEIEARYQAFVGPEHPE